MATRKRARDNYDTMLAAITHIAKRQADCGVSTKASNERLTRLALRITSFEPTPNWHNQAACKGMDPDLFYPLRGNTSDNNSDQVTQICDTCPVQTDCLSYAMNRPEAYGTFGGLSAYNRRTIKRANKYLHRKQQREAVAQKAKAAA